jgi:hypothetical protein
MITICLTTDKILVHSSGFLLCKPFARIGYMPLVSWICVFLCIPLLILLFIEVSNYVANYLNVKNAAPEPITLKVLYETETQSTRPILFITAPGSDPSAEIQKMAENDIKIQPYYQVSFFASEN